MIYVLLIEGFTALPDIIFAVMLIIVLVGVPWILLTELVKKKRTRGKNTSNSHKTYQVLMKTK